jgi:hypothetical protein
VSTISFALVATGSNTFYESLSVFVPVDVGDIETETTKPGPSKRR